MLYNGVSNRWRGWKSRQLGELGAGDGSQFRPPSLRKFDGAARSCSQWNLLGKVRFHHVPSFCNKSLLIMGG